ncbi:MAG TPA: ABC transporter permease [Planctomycetota bacterium]
MTRLVLAWLFLRPVQILAMGGVAVGLLALLVVMSVMNGLIDDDRNSVRGPLSDLLLIPAASEEPASWQAYRTALLADPAIVAVSPHLVAYAVLGLEGGASLLSRTTSSDVNGVQVVGIDVADEVRTTRFLDALEQARLSPVPDAADPFASDPAAAFPRPGILVSDNLARALRLRRGERVQLGALPPRLPAEGELQPHNGYFDVTGTYASSDYGLDMDRVYMRRTSADFSEGSLAWDLLGADAGEFTEVMIKLAPGVDLETGRAAALAALTAAGLPAPGSEGGGALETWEERRAVYLSAIENERRVTSLVMFFIVIVAAFGLFATLSALVREKVRELGILAALGWTPLRRGVLLLGVGATASAVGTALGVAGARWLVDHRVGAEAFLRDRLGIVIFPENLYVVNGLPAVWLPDQARELALLGFGVGVLFTLIPAVRAAALSPVEALRYE